MNKLTKQTKLVVDIQCEYLEWVVGEITCNQVNKYGMPAVIKNIHTDKYGDQRIVDILLKALAQELIK